MALSQGTTITLSREDLYEQVWSTSTLQLAKKFGISDVGLAKVCTRHQIPKPPLGYWARKAAGKAPDRPPLPVVIDPKLQTVILAPSPPRVERPPAPGDLAAPKVPTAPLNDPDIAGAYERFAQAFHEVKIPDTLRSPLPIISATLAALRRGAKEMSLGGRAECLHLVWPHRNENEACLDVGVGRESLERASRFLNTLLKTLEACGCELEVVRESYRRSALLGVYGSKYQLRLRELTRREPHVPTQKELADKEKYSYTKIPKWDYFPSGPLSFELGHETGNHALRVWADGKMRRVEDMIPEIVRGIMEEADAAKARRKREWEESRRQAMEAQARYEAEKRRKEEQAQTDALVREVERWETSRRIHRYVRVVRRTVLERHGRIDKGSELDTWMSWASSVANRLDPLAPRPSTPVATGQSAQEAP